ncbi:Phytosulfokine receptor 1 [Acorus calamus]|uniref:Phytosulfokine receptor 1 n=1 Tax=Acorus calamus TaxID=4465 RepID=A0AAV9DTA4_ACOCL|nr:Phytosulfokine receptor 1 [Acorus calamus]
MKNRLKLKSNLSLFPWPLPMMVGIRFLWVFVGLLTLAFRVSDSQNLGCNPADLNALDGFLKGLDSGAIVGWGSFNGSSSSSSSDCCNWLGVSCELGRVVRLDLGNKSLKGPVSDSLSGLDRLRFLNLSFNSLHGSVPSKLFRLSNLEILDLSFNGLSGGLPAHIQLPSINIFDISGNGFNGSHPILSESPNLTTYNASFNVFYGGINTSMCNTSPRIQSMGLSMNMLSGEFPSGFGNCSSLHHLCVDSNNLSGELPDDLFTLTSLKQLFIQDNNITGILGDRIVGPFAQWVLGDSPRCLQKSSETAIPLLSVQPFFRSSAPITVNVAFHSIPLIEEQFAEWTDQPQLHFDGRS